MKEVERTFGNLKEILRRVRPGLEDYDRLFYQAIISKDPSYGFLKFMVSVGAGGVTLRREELLRLLVEFVKARHKLVQYTPRGRPIKDVRFRLVKQPHKYASDRRDLKNIIVRSENEKAIRKYIERYLSNLSIYGSLRSRYPVTYYSDIDVKLWYPAKIIALEATSKIPISASPLGRYTRILDTTGLLTFFKMILKLFPTRTRLAVIRHVARKLTYERYDVLKYLTRKYHKVDYNFLEKIFKVLDKYTL